MRFCIYANEERTTVPLYHSMHPFLLMLVCFKNQSKSNLGGWFTRTRQFQSRPKICFPYLVSFSVSILKTRLIYTVRPFISGYHCSLEQLHLTYDCISITSLIPPFFCMLLTINISCASVQVYCH